VVEHSGAGVALRTFAGFPKASPYGRNFEATTELEWFGKAL
jgi:hypothetical protein